MSSLPLWLHESIIYGVAAFVFCSASLPIVYIVGVRDGRRSAKSTWVAHGFNRACFLMGIERHREVYCFPHLPDQEELIRGFRESSR